MTVDNGQSSVVSKEAGVKPMTKKILVWLLTTVFLATVSPAEAQQPKKIAKIGYLAPSTPAAAAHLAEAFRQGLRELGLSKGKLSSWSFATARPEPNDFRSSRGSW